MILALAAALLMVSAYAVLQHLTIRRLTTVAEPEPSSADEDTGLAILELIEAKLTECPDEWTGKAGTMTHKPSGTVIAQSGDTMMVRRGEIAFGVPDDWRQRIERACQLRNAKEFVEALSLDKAEPQRTLEAATMLPVGSYGGGVAP